MFGENFVRFENAMAEHCVAVVACAFIERINKIRSKC
jgi:hypothetical protein